MDSPQLDNNMEIVGDQPPQCTVVYDISGDPQVLPRIGNDYQTEIPPLVNAYNDDQLPCVVTQQPDCSAAVVEEQNMVLLGLTLPIRWSNYKVDNINRLFYFRKCKSDAARLKFDKLDSDTLSGDGKNNLASLYYRSTSGDSKRDVEREFFPLPDSLVESWTGLERDSFLLALYIFGKNFFFVRNFVETKKMGDVLSFYYINFYGSDEHRRWSDCRKLRSKKCIFGQSMFIGWRQQELSSRLCSHLCEERKKTLLELSLNFGNEKITYEEYIFSLKEAVGIRLFVEAVAIGKGKQDLTRTALEPVKANCAISGRSEIPVGKACSSLSSEEIIKFLTGDFRLSKARSSDLFWEAVWPRLLARGWQSEQPKDSFPGSKTSLVFLIPGVKKFSRNKLVKGNHYFDSVSDVLNKVASEPGLLELNMETDKDNDNEEKSRSSLPINQDQNGSSTEQCCQDLPPRNSNCNHGRMKFTVVDTSLCDGKGRSKVWSLRCLPAEVLCGSTACSSTSSETEESSEESKDETDKTNASNSAHEMTDTGANADLAESITGTLDNCVPSAFDPTDLMEEDGETQKTSVLSGHQQIEITKVNSVVDPTKLMEEDHETPKTTVRNDNRKIEISKCQSRHDEETGFSNHVVPAIMQQGLIPCSSEKSICSTQNITTDCKPREQESGCQSNSRDMHDDQQVEPTENTLSASFVDKCSQRGSSGVIACMNSSFGDLPLDKPEAGAMIDLNSPHISPISSGTVPNDDDSQENVSSASKLNQKHQILEPSNAGPSTEQQPSLNSRRQSTRTRPLTIKALEALQCGFLDPKKKRKGDDSSKNASSSKPSPRVRARTGNMSPSHTNINIEGSGLQETNMTGVSSNEADVVGKSQL